LYRQRDRQTRQTDCTETLYRLYRQTDRHTDCTETVQTHRHTDREKDRQTRQTDCTKRLYRLYRLDRQTYRQTDCKERLYRLYRQIDRQTDYTIVQIVQTERQTRQTDCI